MTKGIPISFRLPAETRTALEKVAKEDMRSISSMLEKIVTEYLRQNGHLPR
jgi:hypothetical protein